MPALFIVFIIFIVLTVIVGLGSLAATTKDGRVGARVTAGVLGFIALLMLVFSSITSIGTQDIGVVTSFGRPVGHGLSSGLHWKAPWEKVTKLDAKQQTDTYASNGFNGSTQDNAQGGCINVRIARQATACVNISIRWQNDAQGIDYLFRNFKTDDNIRTQLLHRDLQAAVNTVFATYDPLGLDTNGDSTQPSNAALGASIKNTMDAQVGKYLDIINVYVPLFNFDNETQRRLNLLQQQVAQTRIAQQAEQTATAQAAANRALAKSVSNDPGVLVSKCLDILAEAVQKGQALPAGFSCFGGTNTAVAVK
jgi:regulator of protease activity HflC (stomatin/prohibitin superfamily)